MNNLIISNDNFLIKGLKLINDNVDYNPINNIRHYITDFSDCRKVVFIDDRVKNINLLSIRNLYRKNDAIVRINFLQDEKIINFFDYSIKADLPLNEFIESILNTFISMENSKESIENKKHLTPMQAKVLSLLLSGMSIGGVCSYFKMSRGNISNYKNILTRKYGCRNFGNFYKSFISE